MGMPESGVIMASEVCHGYEGLGGLNKKTGLYHPYHVAADKPGLLTIGRGHLLHDDEFKNGIMIAGKKAMPQDGLTFDQVNQLFAQDVKARIDVCWSKIGRRGKPHEAGAMLSLFFNCPAAFGPNSTPLRKYLYGDIQGTAEGIMLYTKSAGKHQRGLFRRRGTEALLLKTGVIHIAKTDATEQQLEQLLKAAGIKYKKPKF